MKYRINEIFYSLQGEGYHTGTAAIFIRFAGCNLKCDFCDTDFKENYQLTKEQILNEIRQYNCKMIIFTGGEPTLQLNEDLIGYLKNFGYYLAIETNGTNKVSKNIDWITVSPKNENLKQIYGNELKLIFDTLKPEKFIKLQFNHFYLQPKSEQNIDKIINYIKENTKWKLSLQTQKLLKIR